MQKKTIGLLGALAGLAAMGSAQAAAQPANVSEALHASSYADLLAPVPDAVALLKADDEARAQRQADETLNGVQLAQYYGQPHHHHHDHYRRPPPRHHHHNRYRRPSHHHHHQQYQQYQ